MRLHKGNMKEDPLKANAMLSHEGQKEKKKKNRKKKAAIFLLIPLGT